MRGSVKQIKLRGENSTIIIKGIKICVLAAKIIHLLKQNACYFSSFP
jgi:hypothetical protein